MVEFKSIDDVISTFLSTLESPKHEEIEESSKPTKEEATGMPLPLADYISPKILQKLSKYSLYRVWAESILYKEMVVLFCGDSGSGKTQMINHFSKYANAIPFSDNMAWVFFDDIGKPYVFKSTNQAESEIVRAPLDWIVYLTSPDLFDVVESGFRRVPEVKLKKQIVDILLAGNTYPKRIRNLFDSMVTQVDAFEYNATEGKHFDNYTKIKQFIDS